MMTIFILSIMKMTMIIIIRMTAMIIRIVGMTIMILIIIVMMMVKQIMMMIVMMFGTYHTKLSMYFYCSNHGYYQNYHYP